MNGLAKMSNVLVRMILSLVLACVALTLTGNAWAHSAAVNRVLNAIPESARPVYVGEITRDGQTYSQWRATIDTPYAALLALANADLPEGSPAVNEAQLDGANFGYVLAYCNHLRRPLRLGIFPAVNGDSNERRFNELERDSGPCHRSSIDHYVYNIPHARQLTPAERLDQLTTEAHALAVQSDAQGIADHADAMEDEAATLATATPSPSAEQLTAFQLALRAIRHHLGDLATAHSSTNVPATATTSSATAPAASPSSSTANAAPLQPAPRAPSVAVTNSTGPSWGWLLITLVSAFGMLYLGVFIGRKTAPVKIVEVQVPSASIKHVAAPVAIAPDPAQTQLIHRLQKSVDEQDKQIRTLKGQLKTSQDETEQARLAAQAASTTLEATREELRRRNLAFKNLNDTFKETQDQHEKAEADREGLTTRLVVVQQQLEKLFHIRSAESGLVSGLLTHWRDATIQFSNVLAQLNPLLRQTLDAARKRQLDDVRKLGNEVFNNGCMMSAILKRGCQTFTQYADQLQQYGESAAVLQALPAPSFDPVELGEPALPLLELLLKDAYSEAHSLNTPAPVVEAPERDDERTQDIHIPARLRENGSPANPYVAKPGAYSSTGATGATLPPPGLVAVAESSIADDKTSPSISLPAVDPPSGGSGSSNCNVQSDDTRSKSEYDGYNPDGRDD